MSKRKIIIFSCILAVIVLLAAIPVMYSWYTGAKRSDDFSIVTANVESSARLFKGVDFDKDGYLNVADNSVSDIDSVSENELDGISQIKCNTYLYDVVEKNKITTNPDTYQNNFSLSITNMIPTEVDCWMLQVKNAGDVNGYINIAVGLPEISEANLALLKVLSIRANADGEALGEKCYLGASLSLDSEDGHYILRDIMVPCFTNNIEKVYIQIEFETLAALTDNGVSITDSEYQSFQGKSITQTVFLNFVLSSNKSTD